MATFIKSSCENTVYKNTDITNDPINIDLVERVSKIKEKWYPDNEGTPAILFRGLSYKWVYGKHQEKERDADYERIVNNKFKEL